MMNKDIIQCTELSKSYHDGHAVIHVLNGITLSIPMGARIAIIGPSGSGKSTLLHALGGLDKPTSGCVLVDGVDPERVSEFKRCRLRNEKLGFVYQSHHLLPEFSALENVAMPLLLAGMQTRTALQRSETILSEVGLSDRLTHKPAALSGGERQRVAIARALVHRPSCVLADEPTGNLDQTTARAVFDVILSLNTQYNTALVIVTHDKLLADRMDHVMVLENGVLK